MISITKTSTLHVDTRIYALLYKRLEAGTFRWPRTESDLKNLTFEQFSRLMQGFTIDPGIKKIAPPESML